MSVLKNATVRVAANPEKKSNIAKLTAGAIVLSFASLMASAPSHAAGQYNNYNQNYQTQYQAQNQALAAKVVDIQTVKQNRRIRSATNSAYSRASSASRTAARSATSSLLENVLGDSGVGKDASRILGNLAAGTVSDAINDRRRAHTNRVNVSLAVLVNGQIQPMMIEMARDDVNFRKGQNVMIYPNNNGGAAIVPVEKNTNRYR